MDLDSSNLPTVLLSNKKQTQSATKNRLMSLNFPHLAVPTPTQHQTQCIKLIRQKEAQGSIRVPALQAQERLVTLVVAQLPAVPDRNRCPAMALLGRIQGPCLELIRTLRVQRLIKQQ